MTECTCDKSKSEPKNFWIVMRHADAIAKFDSYDSAVREAYNLKETEDGRLFILRTVGYVDNKRIGVNHDRTREESNPES